MYGKGEEHLQAISKSNKDRWMSEAELSPRSHVALLPGERVCSRFLEEMKREGRG